MPLAGVALLLATLQPENLEYVTAVETFFSWYLPGPGRTVPHTVAGLAYPYKVCPDSMHAVLQRC